MTECRLLRDPPGPGPWNMAVDEMLLDWAGQHEACCWRFYRWQEATLSLGYFQDYAERAEHPSSRNCPVVRRLTGGERDSARRRVDLQPGRRGPPSARRAGGGSHGAAHETLVETLAEFGVAATLCQPAAGLEARPPLVFPAAPVGDVLGANQNRR